MKRRKFVKNTASAGVAFSLLGLHHACKPSKEKDDLKERKLAILILGGTSFLGPHQIAYALDRGHSITTFTRGLSMPTVHQDLFSQVEMLIGDREDNLEALKGRKWDVVIDNSGRKVQWTKDTAALLKDNVTMYMYTSSTGVYYPYLGDNIVESTPLLREVPKEIKDEYMQMEYDYGVMKTNSEYAVLDEFGPDRSYIIRPTYMMGPGDKTDRFIHWPLRLSRGGEVLVPGKAIDPIQCIDVRDVAEWMIRLAEQSMTGAYNAVGPKEKMSISEFVKESAKAFDVTHEWVQIDDYQFLKDHNVHYIVPWIMPSENNYGSARISNKLAMENGIQFRPLAESVSDIYHWWLSENLTKERREKFENNPENPYKREEEILAQWKDGKTSKSKQYDRN